MSSLSCRCRCRRSEVKLGSSRPNPSSPPDLTKFLTLAQAWVLPCHVHVHPPGILLPPPPPILHGPMPHRLHGHGLLVFGVLLLLLLRPAASNTLSTFAMAKAESTTIVCALLPSAASPVLVDLNCTAAGGDHERQETYPSSHPFSALAGGDHFLCAVGPSAVKAGDVAMRWWDLSKNRTGAPETNGTKDGAGKSKRVYLGPPLQALSSGGYRVCGVLTGGELHCWRWRGLKIPDGLRFVSVAVGDWFVCGILAGGTKSIRCFGNDTEAVTTAPRGGSFDVVAAHGRRACALSMSGGLFCWGNGAPLTGGGEDAATTGYAALALGTDGVCGLRTNGTIRCFGDGVASPPGSLADSQYVDVQAHGRVFCGVLMANYSLVCWGGREFNATNRLVFDRVLPGPCVDMSTCNCGVLPGSANLCDTGRCICRDCAFEFNIATPSAPLGPGSGKSSSSRRSRIIWVAVAAGAFLVLLVALQFVLLLWCRRRRRRRDAQGDQAARVSLMLPRHGSSKGPGSVVEHFTLEVLQAATEGFSDERRIGSGSFGSVYRGTLPDGREVAIKRAEDQAKSSSSARPARRRDRETAFNSELTALARANHKNIVCLLGCCADSGERVLVYEYMANGTLHDQLHDRSPMAPPVSTWRGRLTIALDAARGIEYMHVYAVPNIIHRDIKSANILLDDSWTAKIADFGLSSVLEPAAAGGGDCEGSTSRPLYTGGTVGYMDPEYYRMQHLTDKSDVYSFGVVLLELMSGCRVVQRYAESVTPKNVVEFAVPHILADEVPRVLDPRLPPPTPHETDALAYVGYLAADCVGPVGCDRPSMTEVVDALERALAACAAAPLSRSGTARRVLSRSGTDQFDLTDTD
ncbi:serine/threonine-protein kinase-like protein CCR4 [Oryza brachyantha]|uniref:serine/threonine-protein kinase-like protein CCR4 n=1 Tax=Oryza brachyantha TaxID=4533 RepID=UPI001ADD334E|nr:serine/threonine-protein kinase-like protein CCR4 [Oryza brachyantha]